MNLRLVSRAPERGTDSWGSGKFGASRGERIHRGVDYAIQPESILLSPVAGYVTKLGYPYGDDLTYRYVEVTTKDKDRHRFFYVDPLVELGDKIKKGDDLGIVQNVAKRYDVPKGMKPHVHYEIIDENGIYIDPSKEWR